MKGAWGHGPAATLRPPAGDPDGRRSPTGGGPNTLGLAGIHAASRPALRPPIGGLDAQNRTHHLAADQLAVSPRPASAHGQARLVTGMAKEATSLTSSACRRAPVLANS